MSKDHKVTTKLGAEISDYLWDLIFPLALWNVSLKDKGERLPDLDAIGHDPNRVKHLHA